MSQLDYEKEDVSVSKIAIYSLLPVIFLVVSILGVHYFLKRAQFKTSLFVNKANTGEVTNLEINAKRQLRSYVKKDNGNYTIPIDRAIGIYIQE
ncbi:hypothetical protein MRY82_00730 [bacterium]|nr:hypothetical protein [bacterium]